VLGEDTTVQKEAVGCLFVFLSRSTLSICCCHLILLTLQYGYGICIVRKSSRNFLL